MLRTRFILSLFIFITTLASQAQTPKALPCDLRYFPGTWAQLSISRERPADTTLQRLQNKTVDSTFRTWKILNDNTAYLHSLPGTRIVKTKITFAPGTCIFSFGKKLNKDPFFRKEIIVLDQHYLLLKGYNPKGAPEYLYFVRLFELE